MSIYAIGDIQGCFNEFMRLLDEIQFDENHDTLWFTGDLVNRGLQSLEVLRFVKGLGERHKVVLGNHDLHLLAVVYGGKLNPTDTFDSILAAHDRTELMDWLRHLPLFYYDQKVGYSLVHAGIAASWDGLKAKALAHEVEALLQSDSPVALLEVMYGDQPDRWDDALQGKDRLRCIINTFTRMRLCHPDGRLDLSYKGQLNNKPPDLIPWFNVPNRVNKDLKIIFGHWAALGGKTDVPNVYALDTGCVWGNSLTAMRLGDEKRFCVQCK